MGMAQTELFENQPTITGTVDGIRFRNESTGWTVMSISTQVEGETIQVAAVGNLPAVRSGDEYKLIGKWSDHPKFGKQFQFDTFEVILPSTRQGIVRYLTTAAYGVGMAKARKIVDALGDDTLQKIKDNPAVLNDFDFLNEEQSDEIAGHLAQNETLADITALICREGIGKGTAMQIYNKYKDESVKVIKENPYILCDEVAGIAFKKADAVAQAVGVDPQSPYRVEAAYRYILDEASGGEGHCFLTPNETLRNLIGKNKRGKKGILYGSGIEQEDVINAYKNLSKRELITREGDAIFDVEMQKAEIELANGVLALVNRGKTEMPHINELIHKAEQVAQIEYASEQRTAIGDALTHPVSIITGGPGTGKSETVEGICNIYKELYPEAEIYKCAPTGRAAKRIEGKTFHRLLRYNPYEGGFEYGYGNPLPGPGLIVADEFSMAGLILSRDFFSALDDHKIVIVGDVDQLPSVSAGNVLRDMIDSGVIPTTRLKFNFRQANGSKIAEFANMVKDGIVPPFESIGDYNFHHAVAPGETADKIIELIKWAIKEGYGIMDFQVLPPMYKGDAGVNKLNERIREMVNPKGKELAGFRVNDKVMVVRRNLYKIGAYNGDIGQVVELGKGKVVVDFGDDTADFTSEYLPYLQLAYAGTVHKAQGSEFPLVIEPVIRSFYIMLQRELFYTGMTRPRQDFHLVGDPAGIKIAVKNNKVQKRNSLLKERLRGEV